MRANFKLISSFGLLCAMMAQSQAQVNTTLTHGVRFYSTGTYFIQLREHGVSGPVRNLIVNAKAGTVRWFTWSAIVTNRWYQVRATKLESGTTWYGSWFYVPPSNTFQGLFLHAG